MYIRDAGGGSVKQPDDRATLELPGLEPAKRGRGRPRKPDALTPAQRAKRYRLRLIARATEGARWGSWEWSRGLDALEQLERMPAHIAAPAAAAVTYKCHKCGQTAVYGPRVACDTCWPFPSGSP